MALQQSLGLGVEISLQDRFTPVAMKVTASFQQMRAQITAGAQDISRSGQMMGQAMGQAGAGLRPSIGKSGGGKNGSGGSGFSGLQNVIGGVATALVALKGVTAGFSAFDGLTEIAGTFDKAVVSAGALMNLGWKQTPKEMKMLEKAAIDAGIATQFTPTQAAEGLALLGQSGYNATEATKLLIPTLNLAAAGEMSVAQAASTMSAGVKIFGLDIGSAANATDKMLRIANATSLTAGDLQIALGNVSRGAIVTGQSMDEMLPSIGLVKNAGVDASVASSSVSSALLMMAKNSKKLKDDLGVNVTDAAGNFRPMMDVIYEVDQAMKKKIPNAAARSSKAMELFGKFGLSAFANMSAQMTSGITGAGGKKVTGTDAIAYLRKSMASASDNGGAANEFKERLLNTFEGQKILLRGSMETLAITLGQPFTVAMRPIVAGVTDLVNKIITVVQGMSPELKLFLAKFAIGVASLASFATAAIGVGAAVSTIAGPVMEVIGALGTLGPIGAALAAVFGVFTAVFSGFKVAYENDVGGFGTFLADKLNSAKLIVLGLAQVFTSGQISGPVADELSKTENAGLLAFIGRLYATFNQVKSFIDSFVTGFKESIKSAGPIFHDFSASIELLMGNFSGLTEAIDGDKMSGEFAKSNASGQFFGTTVANSVLLIVAGLTRMIQFTDGVIGAWDRMKSTFSGIGDAFGGFFGFFGEIVNEFHSLTAAGESSGSSLSGIGWYIANIWSNLGSVIGAALGFAKNMFLAVGNVVVGFGEIIYGVFTLNGTMIWNGFKRVAFGAITGIIGMLGFMGETAGAVIDWVGALFGQEWNVSKGVKGFKDSLIGEFKTSMGLDAKATDARNAANGVGPSNVVPEKLTAPAGSLFATNDAADAAGAAPFGSMAAMPAMGGTSNAEVVSAINNLAKRPIEVTVNISGRTVASSTADASADEADRGYADNGPTASE